MTKLATAFTVAAAVLVAGATPSLANGKPAAKAKVVAVKAKPAKKVVEARPAKVMKVAHVRTERRWGCPIVERMTHRR